MNSCLCKTHENTRLMLKAVSRNISPDKFVEETSVEQVWVTLEETLPSPEVKYWE